MSKICRFFVSPLRVARGWCALPLRFIVGYGFFFHGHAKLARSPDGFISILRAIDLRSLRSWGWATIIVELVGGLVMLAGAFVPSSLSR